jgi:hypothetical protein
MADGIEDMTKRGQLLTGSFHGITEEGHWTYLSESMILTVNQLAR